MSEIWPIFMLRLSFEFMRIFDFVILKADESVIKPIPKYDRRNQKWGAKKSLYDFLFASREIN